MKIRQTIFLLPLFFGRAASAGGSPRAEIWIWKELCTEEQVFQCMRILNGERIRNSFSNESFLKFDEKIWDRGDESSTKTYESKEKFSLEMQGI